MIAEVSCTHLDSFLEKIERRSLTAGIVGLGYVGLPLTRLFTSQGFRVLGFDIDAKKTEMLMAGESYIRHIPSSEVAEMRRDDRLLATTDFASICQADTLSICVPTPLDKFRQPDLTAIRETAEALTPHLRPGQLVILESTTYPGTTTEVVLPILRRSGLKLGEELFVGYSPEREDPANPHFTARTIPKVVGANDPTSRRALESFYKACFDQIVPVSSCEAAEMAKILENIYRCVNIALVNEMKLLCQRMGLNIWEIVDAAKTKPFGFQAFYPGPGLGGHCIPIDPFYLSWKTKQAGIEARFIELAGYINGQMPHFVVDKIQNALNDAGKPVKGSHIHILGVAYKKDIEDLRESPALDIMLLLKRRGARLTYSDPYVPHLQLDGDELQAQPEALAGEADCAVIITDHSSFDYPRIAAQARLIVDTRNALKDVNSAHIVRL